jgi:hypothetical protein
MAQRALILVVVLYSNVQIDERVRLGLKIQIVDRRFKYSKDR